MGTQMGPNKILQIKIISGLSGIGDAWQGTSIYAKSLAAKKYATAANDPWSLPHAPSIHSYTSPIYGMRCAHGPS